MFRSQDHMAAILEILQYVAYQNNVVYALITLLTKSYTLNNAIFLCLAALVVILL